MENVELYRQVFMSFKELCAEGRQPSSFRAYCIANGVDDRRMRQVLKNEFQDIRTLPGYCCVNSRLYADIYEQFKKLCAEGSQPGTFSSYCRRFGVTRDQVHAYLKRKHLCVAGLPGYAGPTGTGNGRSEEIPFEDVIFEESGFLPADTGNLITVKVGGHVAVSFPADTDVAVIARFVRRMGKEAGHVGS